MHHAAFHVKTGHWGLGAMGPSMFLGVALLAGLSAGCLSNLDAVRQVRAAGSRRFDPLMSPAERELWLKRWNSAVHRCLEWHGDALR